MMNVKLIIFMCYGSTSLMLESSRCAGTRLPARHYDDDVELTFSSLSYTILKKKNGEGMESV